MYLMYIYVHIIVSKIYWKICTHNDVPGSNPGVATIFPYKTAAYVSGCFCFCSKYPCHKNDVVIFIEQIYTQKIRFKNFSEVVISKILSKISCHIKKLFEG